MVGGVSIHALSADQTLIGVFAMRVEADFSQISSSFEPLEGTHRMRLTAIQNQADDEEWKAKNATTGKTPALVFVSEVIEGDRIGGQYFDYIYTTTKQGKPNKAGLGKIKAYAEAMLGKEQAADTKGIDLDALVNGTFDGVFEMRKYEDAVTKQEKTSTDLKKILPVS